MNRDNRKTRPIKPANAPKPASGPGAGPRPLSERQRGHLSHLHAAHVGSPKVVLHRAVTGVHRLEPKATKPTGVRYRSGAATAERLRDKRRSNRKRIDWAGVLLRAATVALCAEVVAALLFSPRLWVKTVSVEGNGTVPTAELTRRLAIPPRANILRLLAGRGKLLRALRAEPTVESARITLRFPDGLAVSVTERKPFAAVKFESNPSRWYTLDRNLVPFRVFAGAPEAGLPLVSVVARDENATSAGGVKPVLGVVCNAPGLSDVGTCLAWAKEQGVNFPVEKVTIDNAGKLCLNRVGGIAVLLGPGMDLHEKLGTLSLLLAKRMDLRGSAPTPIAQVNLYAYDAPALVPRAETGGRVPGDATALP